MTTDFVRYLRFSLFLLIIVWTVSCSGRSGSKAEHVVNEGMAAPAESAGKMIKLISPGAKSHFKLKEQVDVVMDLINKDKSPDSVVIYFDGKSVATLKSSPWKYSISPAFTGKTGRKSLKLIAYKGGRSLNPVTGFILIYSDIVPKRNGYKVIHAYPHDKAAFTQGLIFDKGLFYEGTGQQSESNLREVEPETGKILRQHNLDATLFGEGITLYHDRIYQVTWENKVGFVYDRATFSVINKIYYPTQGWGLTTIEDKIVMSDGTNVLAFYEPEMFTQVSRIEVYDNEKEIDSLNELEYINGEIWANIWMTDLIARIDPSSGKVLAYIDLKGILPGSERSSDTDVLNGIAYDKDSKRIFVTGKRWPKIFEIQITE